ncbi:MAG: hypothetical protein JO039_08870 [Solirubrobacterales bacterium]|nr:hypothetical protein [Solirubrobacterales bacterium]
MTDRIGTRTLTGGSMLLAAVALTAIALLADQREVVLLLPAFLAFGIARPIATIAGSAATVGATPLEARAGAVLRPGYAIAPARRRTWGRGARPRPNRARDRPPQPLAHRHRRYLRSPTREALDGILAG